MVHKPICNTLPRLCGNSFVMWRSRENGNVLYNPGKAAREGLVSYNETTVDQNDIDRSVAVAKRFIQEFGQDRCVILTTSPTMGTRLANSRAIASALGIPLMVPANIDGLNTSDGVHLDAPSVERWSRAFLDVAGDRIRECLASGGRRPVETVTSQARVPQRR
jgi:hypothetical protein